MTTLRLSLALLATLALCACAGPASSPAVPEITDDGIHHHGAWDSQDGNPTHATHSYLTEFAIDQLRASFPEVQTYRAQLIDGANREIHDLVLSNQEQEALRIESQGNNWACARPEIYWTKAKARYAAGDKAKAFWYLGILLHHVEDMGTPAHGFHVYHQSSPSNWDDFEVMALQKWSPLYSINRTNPNFATPDQYVVWNGTWATADFQATWPSVTYTRGFYSTSWWWASSKEKTFMRNRQGRCAYATMWALRSAVTHW